MLQKGNREFTLQSRWDRSLTSVGPKRYEGKQRDYNPISVRPILVISFPESWSGKLDGTDVLFSVRLKCYKSETESLHCNLGGTDRSFRLDRNVTKGNKEITIPSRWDQDPYR